MHALLAVATLGLALPAGAAECPQERAIYSLGEATLTLSPSDNPYVGWMATLRAPTAPVRFQVTASNGVVRHFLVSETGHLSSEIVPLDRTGRREWGEAGHPAAAMLRIPNFGPKGLWRLTGCSAP